jgi:hypothetical protein
MTLPDRRLYSDYYQLIKTPMAIDLVEVSSLPSSLLFT